MKSGKGEQKKPLITDFDSDFGLGGDFDFGDFDNSDFVLDGDTDGLTLSEQIEPPDKNPQSWTPEGDYEQQVYDSIKNVHAQAKGKEARATHKAALEATSRIKDNTEEFYYATVVFLNNKQLETFLREMGWNKFHMGTYVLDGLSLAESYGVSLPEVAYKPYERKADPKLAALSLDFDDEIYSEEE